MATERRNLYRLLYLQPEAPAELIKAAHRTLMMTLRMHPDLGGDHEVAARLNTAYAVLSDPDKRRAYDQSLRRPARHSASPATPPSPSHVVQPEAAPSATDWLAQRRCPFCLTAFTVQPKPGAHCVRCDSPLTPVPKPSKDSGAELLGRRGGERFARNMPAQLMLPGDARLHTAQLRDLSFTGLSLFAPMAPPKGSVLRVSTGVFDSVVQVVGCRRQGTGFTVHGQLLTLELLQASRGMYVDSKA